MAQRQDRPILPFADRGGVGIRLPRRHDHALFLWQRSQASSAITPGIEENSDFKYQKVGKKKPNPWGLYDMYGNVVEWVLDQYDPDYYKQCAEQVVGIIRGTKPPSRIRSRPGRFLG